MLSLTAYCLCVSTLQNNVLSELGYYIIFVIVIIIIIVTIVVIIVTVIMCTYANISLIVPREIIANVCRHRRKIVLLMFAASYPDHGLTYKEVWGISVTQWCYQF